MTTQHESDRTSHLRQLMQAHTDRRSLLQAAAAAGLIPVLSQGRVAAQGAQPKQGGTFVTLSQDSLESLSPEDTGETVQWVGAVLICEGLYTVNHLYELEPTLADSVEPSDDGLTYTFKLKKGVTFHNGDAFTSKDVKYTFDWIMNPENASTHTDGFVLVDTVEAPDDETVVVTLKEADVTFMVNVGVTLIYPAGYHEEIGENAFKTKPVGTGPYMLESINPQSRVVLAAYEGYHGGRPNIDKVQIDVVPEAAGRMSALESGEADNSIWGLNAEDNTTLMDSGNFRVIETQMVAVNHFPLNNDHPFLKEKAVRQALLTAIDRQGFADEVFQGQGVVATSNLSPAVKTYYNPDVATYDYDPEKAMQLLEDAGWQEGGDGIREKDGVKAQFTLFTFQGDTQRRPEAEYAQQMWAEIGVQCDLQEGIASDILGRLPAGEADAGLFNWVYGGNSGDPDARDTLGTGGANNFSRFSNEEVDTLLNDGIRELDQDKRIEMYKRIQEIVADEVPFLYLLYLQNIVFYTNRIKGVPDEVLNSDNLYPRINTFWIEE